MQNQQNISVFLAGIMQGSISDKQIHTQSWRDEITTLLKKYMPQADIYCHFTANRNSLDYSENRVLNTFEGGTRAAANSQLVICWLPQASMGTAIEMYMAYKAGATIVSITPMAINWVVQICSDHIVPDMQGFEALLKNEDLLKTLNSKAAPTAPLPGGQIGRQLPKTDEFWQDGND